MSYILLRTACEADLDMNDSSNEFITLGRGHFLRQLGGGGAFLLCRVEILGIRRSSGLLVESTRKYGSERLQGFRRLL